MAKHPLVRHRGFDPTASGIVGAILLCGLGAGCGGSPETPKAANPKPGAVAAPTTKAKGGRPKADVTSRREHQKAVVEAKKGQ